MSSMAGITQGWSSNNLDIAFVNCVPESYSHMTFYGNPTNSRFTQRPRWYSTMSVFLTTMTFEPTGPENYLRPVEEFMFVCEVSRGVYVCVCVCVSRGVYVCV